MPTQTKVQKISRVFFTFPLLFTACAVAIPTQPSTPTPTKGDKRITLVENGLVRMGANGQAVVMVNSASGSLLRFEILLSIAAAYGCPME